MQPHRYMSFRYVFATTCYNPTGLMHSYHQRWNGLFFGRTSLKDLGLRVQLGHLPGTFCHTSDPGREDFTVINTNGIHRVQVDWCRCEGVDHCIQLLRVGWWPATPLQPQSCASMDALRQFQLFNLQGKLTAFSYYRSLEYLSDNTGLYPLPVSSLFPIPSRSIGMLKVCGRIA